MSRKTLTSVVKEVFKEHNLVLKDSSVRIGSVDSSFVPEYEKGSKQVGKLRIKSTSFTLSAPFEFLDMDGILWSGKVAGEVPSMTIGVASYDFGNRRYVLGPSFNLPHVGIPFFEISEIDDIDVNSVVDKALRIADSFCLNDTFGCEGIYLSGNYKNLSDFMNQKLANAGYKLTELNKSVYVVKENKTKFIS